MEQRPIGRQEPNVEREDAGAVPSDEDESDCEFEFPFVSREPAADELFVSGRIRAFYPVFGRVLDDAAPGPRAPLGRLFQLEEAWTSSFASTSSSSSASTEAAAGDLDGTSPGSYCLWTPGLSLASSPSRPPRKSRSTESIARWRRIGELVVGRSHSDGKGGFLFLSAPSSPAREHASSSKANQPARGNKAAATEVDTVAAGRRMSYGAKASPGARRTFLPYRQDLVGLFGNVHGHSRSHHHPF
ncbi:uncharacterized protein LOC133916612 [Phragmites australis]|uniref:uncharacterized protein LOC133916612 n=1 Tax=Phragmites australis TaxID=29695 RepID=UPI002D779797|nr:uncharacterized protein LOC133916612 [Phragmites australis]